MNKRIGLIALTIFLVYFVIFFIFPNFLLTLELKIFDNFTLLEKRTSHFLPKLNYSTHLDDIVVIIIDEDTINNLKRKLPLPRYFYADLLERIFEVKPKLVVFDIVFSGESEDREDDILLAKAIEGRTNILFPYANDDTGRPLPTDSFFLKDLPSGGYINKPIDADSTIRRIRPFALTENNAIRDCSTEFRILDRYYDYSLDSVVLDKKRVSLNNLKTKKEDRFTKFNFSLRRDNTIWIKYQADKADLNTIPMWRVLLDDFDTSVFDDKVVIVGVTAKILHDIHKSPYGFMAGVEIMANVATMCLDGKFLEESPWWLNWFLIFILCMFTVLACYHLPMFKGLLFCLSLSTITAVLAFGSFLNNYYLNPFKLVFIVVLGYIVINFYKYTSVVMENLNLRKISTTDELTGLHTFRFFRVVINHEFQKSLRYKIPASLLMIDIDNFKKINDKYGHQNGNVVLNKIGKILLNNARKSDFPVRYGGEELAILLPHTNIQGAYKCAETIRKIIEKEDFFMTKEGPKKVTVSIGVSSFPEMDIAYVEDMIKLADTALYKAKHEGKNRVIIYSQESGGSINTG
ncbi:diguanylate cyclase [Candidatus Omnitrophota bacterium]